MKLFSVSLSFDRHLNSPLLLRLKYFGLEVIRSSIFVRDFRLIGKVIFKINGYFVINFLNFLAPSLLNLILTLMIFIKLETP